MQPEQTISFETNHVPDVTKRDTKTTRYLQEMTSRLEAMMARVYEIELKKKASSRSNNEPNPKRPRYT